MFTVTCRKLTLFFNFFYVLLRVLNSDCKSGSISTEQGYVPKKKKKTPSGLLPEKPRPTFREVESETDLFGQFNSSCQ